MSPKLDSPFNGLWDADRAGGATFLHSWVELRVREEGGRSPWGSRKMSSSQASHPQTKPWFSYLLSEGKSLGTGPPRDDVFCCVGLARVRMRLGGSCFLLSVSFVCGLYSPERPTPHSLPPTCTHELFWVFPSSARASRVCFQPVARPMLSLQGAWPTGLVVAGGL